MKGYKAFNNDLTCRGYQYEIGKTYEMDDKPIICERGFHFCENIADIFNYYSLNEEDTRVCEVEALGEIVLSEDNSKRSTNKIKILKEISWEELKERYKDKNAGGWFNTGHRNTGNYNTGDYNTGDYNTGYYNTGHYNTGNYNTGHYNTGNRNTGYRNTGYYNTGDYNTGNRNTGYYNTGNYNTGHRNTGHYNTGYYNTGYYNTGHYNTGNYNTGNRNTGHYNTGNYNTGNYNTGYRNTGYYNTGHYNTGDYNTGHRNTGLFNTNEPNARLFNKISDVKMSDIDTYRINDILSFIDKREIKLVYKYEDEMTDQEKIDHPEYKTTGGALIKEKVKVDVQAEWEKVSKKDKNFIINLPNFDADIFYECTGIRV